MLTIEEKIRQLEAIAESGDELYADYEEQGLQDTHGARRAKSLIEEKRQEIAWLRELQERRKAPEIIYCKDCTRRRKNTETGEYYCRASGLRNTDHDFCSGGKRPERRTDD